MIQIGLTVIFLPNVHFSSTIYPEDICVVSLKWVIEKLSCKIRFAVEDDHTHIFLVIYHHLFVLNVSTGNL
jgi:hypothetical protein